MQGRFLCPSVSHQQADTGLCRQSIFFCSPGSSFGLLALIHTDAEELHGLTYNAYFINILGLHSRMSLPPGFDFGVKWPPTQGVTLIGLDEKASAGVPLLFPIVVHHALHIFSWKSEKLDQL